MAVTLSDINFINQNFPGAQSIPVNQIKDLASQLSVTLSDDLNRMLAEQRELDVARVQQIADMPDIDVDISDIPLELNANVKQAFEAPNAPPVDPELAQYDDLMQQAAPDDGIDPAMFGFEPPVNDAPPPIEGPPPEMYEEGPIPEPSNDRKAAFEDDFEGSDLSYLTDKPEYGESVDIQKKYKEVARKGPDLEESPEPLAGSQEAPMAEQDAESTNKAPGEPSDLGGTKTEEQLIVDEIAGDRPVFKMLKDLDELAQVSGVSELDYEVIKNYLKNEVADDEPLLKKLEEEHAKGYSKFSPSVMLKFAKENPPVNEPTSQPQDTQDPTKEAEKKRENEKDGPENKGKEQPQQAPVESNVGAAMVGGAVNAFKAGSGLGYGVSKALGQGLVGGVKNLKGFYDTHKQNQMKMTSDLKSNVSGLSSQLDAIQADRSAMKSAKGAFEKKQYADRMQKKLQVFEKTAAGFADTLSSKQGQKLAKKADMSKSLESLSNKMESVFKGMEPGKGEKKVMENIAASIESAMQAVKAVVEAIKKVFSAPTADGPSNTMHAGPR